MLLRSAFLCAALFAAPLHSSVVAQETTQAKSTTLGVGDMAPAISIEKWVKGEAVPAFQKGKTYMVEFWATWCGPCIAGMPHLTELQKKYADKLTIISVSSADSRGNTLEKVEDMVKKKGDVMGYTVAWDDGQKTTEAYMRAAKQNGIPCAFLVDGNGRIAYIGHPGSIDKTLDLVVSGKHDIDALIAEQKKAKEVEAKSGKLRADLNAAAGAGKWEDAIKICDDIVALDPESLGGFALAKFQILALEIKDEARANKWAKEISEGMLKDDAELLNGLAWTMVDPESPLKTRDADLALKIAERAAEVSKHKSAPILDTLARAWFVKGDAQKAVEWQRKAIAIDPEMNESLAEYEEALAKRG